MNHDIPAVEVAIQEGCGLRSAKKVRTEKLEIILKSHLMPILEQVKENCPEYSEAYRLHKFLQYFESVPDNDLPPTSLLREFLGGSSFKY